MKRISSSSAGLTLLELLVVLTILATLSTIAITSTSGFSSQARYEATQRTLANVRDAILGPENLRDTDGTLIFTGFVADIGRLPKAKEDGANPGVLTLDELLHSNDLETYQVKQAVGGNVEASSSDYADADVWLGTGWRGPYLQLSPGETVIRDGWGGNLQLTGTSGNTPPAVDEPIAAFSSLGDGIDNNASDGYGRKIEVQVDELSYKAQITVQVQIVSGSDPFPVESSQAVSVSLFGPDSKSGKIGVTPQSQALSGEGTNTLTFTVTFGDTTIGPKALRAYYRAGSTVLPTEATQKSPVAMLMVRPGQNFRTLVINVP